MPAFINVHNHIYSSLARGLSIKNHNPKNFLDILDGLWWNLDNHLTLENDKASAEVIKKTAEKEGLVTLHKAGVKHVLEGITSVAELMKIIAKV